MSNEQNRRWLIGPDGVHGGSNKSQLINCSVVRDALTGDYHFYGPLSNLGPETSIKSPVEFPFWFPKFRSALNGTVRHDWYIKVDTVDFGLEFDQAHGRWRNTPPPIDDDGDPAPTDTDTWTSQAGVGGHPEDKKKDKKVAATASSKQ
jgi:hypothetical protein